MINDINAVKCKFISVKLFNGIVFTCELYIIWEGTKNEYDGDDIFIRYKTTPIPIISKHTVANYSSVVDTTGVCCYHIKLDFLSYSFLFSCIFRRDKWSPLLNFVTYHHYVYDVQHAAFASQNSKLTQSLSVPWSCPLQLLQRRHSTENLFKHKIKRLKPF